MRRGFTIIEILAAVLIIAVLASILIPRATKAKEKVNQRQAESYLRAIRTSQKMYYARNGLYQCSGTSCSNAATIKTALGTEVKDGAYTFSITGNSSAFTVTADTTGTANDITVDQDGNFTKGGTSYTPV